MLKSTQFPFRNQNEIGRISEVLSIYQLLLRTCRALLKTVREKQFKDKSLLVVYN